MAAFGNEDIAVLVSAYDRAWDTFVRTGDVRATTLTETQAALARSICAYASEGVLDERRLALQALAELNQKNGYSGC